jgi:hypothetical protein
MKRRFMKQAAQLREGSDDAACPGRRSAVRRVVDKWMQEKGFPDSSTGKKKRERDKCPPTRSFLQLSKVFMGIRR